MSSSNPNNNILNDLGLSPNTIQHTYQNINDFIEILSNETDLFTTDNQAPTRSQYIVFHEVTESRFQRDFIDPIDSLVTFESYFLRRGILVVKIITKGQAAAASTLGTQISLQLSEMGKELAREILPLGSAHVISKNRIKRADQSFLSRRLYKARSTKWPSLRVEVGYSDSPRKLEGDAKWWIGESRGEVRDVITVELDKTRREMKISQWRSCDMRESRLEYRLVIAQEGDGRMQVSEGKDLVVPFEDLFVRSANRDKGERDVVIEVEELKSIAEMVWEVEFERFKEE